jgi:type II secretory pathway pseudopilin PulG
MHKRSEVMSRKGLTLIEILISLGLMLVIFAAAVPFFRVQTRSVDENAGRMDAQQSARFAINTIDRELRVAGLGVADAQPLLVQADAYAITFNADLVTPDPTDPGAVYYDPDLPAAVTAAMSHVTQVQLPRSAEMYPQVSYFEGGVPSRAETVSYWVSADSSSPRADEHVLWRRVNRETPQLVAKGIVVTPGEPIFRYFKPDSVGRPTEIPAGQLPLIHTAPMHGDGVLDDTGGSALTDSVRMVRIRFVARYHDPEKGNVEQSVESSVRLLNAGMIRRTTCGESPLSTGITAVYQAGPPAAIQLTWNPSGDQDGGERDVERYVVFRRIFGSGEWGEPYASLTATEPSYTYFDEQIVSGERYEYGLIAQDCSPRNSSLTMSAPILVP